MAATPDPPASTAERLMLTAPAYHPLEQALPLQVIVEVGAVVSTGVVLIEINCDFVASTFPALSQARYLTVPVAETVNGAEYVELPTVGSEPSVVYRITATPEDASVADRATDTGALYQPLPHGALLQVIEEEGAVVSVVEAGGGVVGPPIT